MAKEACFVPKAYPLTFTLKARSQSASKQYVNGDGTADCNGETAASSVGVWLVVCSSREDLDLHC